MLTVGIDATPLVGDRTGIGVAVHGMVRELATRDDLQLVGYGLTTRGWSRLRHLLPDGVRSGRAPMPAGVLLRLWKRADAPPIEWFSGHLDVVHGTNFVVPPARHAARLVTVWDLTAVLYPEMTTRTSRRYPELIRRAIDEGAWVHTAASSVAAEVVDYFGADPGMVRVIAPGLDIGAASTRGVGNGRPYLLGLGTSEPRKGFPTLVAAFDEIAGDLPDLELRIAGPRGWGDAQLQAAIDEAKHRDRIRREGWVEDPAGLIAGATAFVFPSLYEGFGFPPLEAMALGVPVVATSAGSLPEVLADAAEMVAPGDSGALASALRRVVTDDGLRERLIAAGERQAARFNRESSARSLVDLYREIAASGKRSGRTPR